MSPHISRSQRVVEVFAADVRPGADALVYCKGCGDPLTGQPRIQERRVTITTMMCESCQELHGHALMPGAGAPTFCFRCGGQDTVVIEKAFSPITHRLCPRCVPERLARYQAGNFNAPQVTPAT